MLHILRTSIHLLASKGWSCPRRRVRPRCRRVAGSRWRGTKRRPKCCSRARRCGHRGRAASSGGQPTADAAGSGRRRPRPPRPTWGWVCWWKGCWARSPWRRRHRALGRSPGCCAGCPSTRHLRAGTACSPSSMRASPERVHRVSSQHWMPARR